MLARKLVKGFGGRTRVRQGERTPEARRPLARARHSPIAAGRGDACPSGCGRVPGGAELHSRRPHWPLSCSGSSLLSLVPESLMPCRQAAKLETQPSGRHKPVLSLSASFPSALPSSTDFTPERLGWEGHTERPGVKCPGQAEGIVAGRGSPGLEQEGWLEARRGRQPRPAQTQGSQSGGVKPGRLVTTRTRNSLAAVLNLAQPLQFQLCQANGISTFRVTPRDLSPGLGGTGASQDLAG